MSRPDAFLDRYLRLNIKLKAWCRTSDECDRVTDKDVFGEIVGIQGCFWVNRQLERESAVESVVINPVGGPEIEISCKGLSLHYLREPFDNPFGIVGIFPERREPTELAISTMSMRLASQGNWDLIKAFEWSQVTELARTGDLRPESVSEPEGYRWTPIGMIDIPQDPSQWLIRWGLLNMAAKLKGERRRDVLLDKKVTILTDIDGHGKELQTIDGQTQVVDRVIERRRAKRLVDNACVEQERRPSHLRAVVSKS